MTNRLELNWKLDGFVDEQRYYCSLTPINTNSLPAPKAVLAGDVRAHTDSDITPGDVYHVRVGSVKDGTEKLGDEITVATNHYLYLPFTHNLKDSGKHKLTATSFGGAVIQNGCLYVPSGGYVELNTTGLSDFNINAGDFELGAEVCLMSGGSGDYPSIFALGTNWGNGAVSMQYNPQRKFMGAFHGASVEVDAFSPINQIEDGLTFVKYKVRRVAGVVTTYADNVAGVSINDNLLIDLTKNGVITIGAATWALSVTKSHSKIRNLYLKKI